MRQDRSLRAGSTGRFPRDHASMDAMGSPVSAGPPVVQGILVVDNDLTAAAEDEPSGYEFLKAKGDMSLRRLLSCWYLGKGRLAGCLATSPLAAGEYQVRLVAEILSGQRSALRVKFTVG